MLVSFAQTLTATEVFKLGRFGEVSLSGAGRLYNSTAVAAPGAAAQAVAGSNNRSRIILDDGNNQQNIDPTRYPLGGLSATNTLRVGDTLPGLTGVMDFRFSIYRIQPVGRVDFQRHQSAHGGPGRRGRQPQGRVVQRPQLLQRLRLRAAGFPTARGANSVRVRPPGGEDRHRAEGDRRRHRRTDGDRERRAAPTARSPTSSPRSTRRRAPGTYAFIDTGVIGTDAIKVALIYKPAAVTPVGAWKILTTADRPALHRHDEPPGTGADVRHNAPARCSRSP